MGTEPVRLLLVRHGEAERMAERDDLRQLTYRGRAEVAATANLLAGWGIPAPRVYTSRYLRARETADILAERLGSAAPTVLEGITPDDDPRSAWRRLAPLCAPGVTPVVATHMPLVGTLIAWLEEGSFQHPRAVATAGGALLEGEIAGPGTLRVVRFFPGG